MINVVTLRMQHVSLQFSDPRPKQKEDVKKLFELGEDFPIKTGTEAAVSNRNDNNHFLREFADRFNHIINFAGDNWVAIDRSIIVPGSVDKNDIFVVDNSQVAGAGEDRIMPTLSFKHRHGAGRISVGAAHYPTQGQNPGRPNHLVNRKYAEKIQLWMRNAGQGRDLAFVNGDFNMDDRNSDWAFGGNFTSIADELKAWQNTGHGPIDGFCSFDRDGRVKAQSFRVLDDSELHMNTDHFVCRAVWEIEI